MSRLTVPNNIAPLDERRFGMQQSAIPADCACASEDHGVVEDEV